MATSIEEASGYDVNVIGNFSPDLTCSICMYLIKDAVNGCDAHVFCKLCIDKYVKFGIRRPAVNISCVIGSLEDEVLCPGGCRLPITTTELKPNNVIDRMINKLPVKCPHDNCTWLGELLDFVQICRKDIYSHENELSAKHTRLIYENFKTENSKFKEDFLKKNKEISKKYQMSKNEITELKKQVFELEKTSKELENDIQDRAKTEAKVQGDKIREAVNKQINKPITNLTIIAKLFKDCLFL